MFRRHWWSMYNRITSVNNLAGIHLGDTHSLLGGIDAEDEIDKWRHLLWYHGAGSRRWSCTSVVVKLDSAMGGWSEQQEKQNERCTQSSTVNKKFIRDNSLYTSARRKTPMKHKLCSNNALVGKSSSTFWAKSAAMSLLANRRAPFWVGVSIAQSYSRLKHESEGIGESKRG